MPALTPRERALLALICDTLIPALSSPPAADAPHSGKVNGSHAARAGCAAGDAQPGSAVAERVAVVGDDAGLWGTGAHALDLAARVEAALAQTATGAEWRGLRLFLRLIATGTGGAFEALTPAQRECRLLAWAHSRVPQARQAFQSVKRLAMFLFYSAMPDDQPNPTWAAFGYAAPDAAPPRPALPLFTIRRDDVVYADVLVIGSGAGGGVVTGRLAEAGADVLVVEKGGAADRLSGRELDSTTRLFERAGTLTTRDGALLVLAGSTLGGGTTVNWAAALATPDAVRAEWARDFGFAGALSPAFDAALQSVSARIGVHSASAANPQNCALEAGCAALGYAVGVIPRNTRGCAACDFCSFGCPHGAKQSTAETYLRDAAADGTRIAVEARAERITIERGRATGALVRLADGRTVRVRAGAVVAAGGALHTPALLLRSGMTHAQIGRNLHLHPTTSIYGTFEQPIRGWAGAPMTRYSPHFADLDGGGYGVRLETAPVHPGIAALSIPYEGGAAHKAVMAGLAHLANIIIIARDHDGGRVTLDGRGEPRLEYRLSARDAAHLMRGTVEALRIQAAAGALALSSPHTPPLLWDAESGVPLTAYLDAVAGRGIAPNRFALFSAHQMSSARMAGSRRLGVAQPTGETWDVRGLWIADASALPTACGVNPMLTIMAVAHWVAGQMVAVGVRW